MNHRDTEPPRRKQRTAERGEAAPWFSCLLRASVSLWFKFLPAPGSSVQANPAPGDAPRWAGRAARAAGAGVAIMGLAVLAGWVLDVSVLKSVIPGLVSMKANTAVCFALAGSSLWVAASPRHRAGLHSLAAASALLVVTCGLASCFEYLGGLNVGIDEFLFRDPASEGRGLPPGRMAFATAVAFVLTGASLLFLRGRGSVVAQYLACATAQ